MRVIRRNDKIPDNGNAAIMEDFNRLPAGFHIDAFMIFLQCPVVDVLKTHDDIGQPRCFPLPDELGMPDDGIGTNIRQKPLLKPLLNNPVAERLCGTDVAESIGVHHSDKGDILQ